MLQESPMLLTYGFPPLHASLLTSQTSKNISHFMPHNLCPPTTSPPSLLSNMPSLSSSTNHSPPAQSTTLNTTSPFLMQLYKIIFLHMPYVMQFPHHLVKQHPMRLPLIDCHCSNSRFLCARLISGISISILEY